jgi:hypothetical protein
MIVRSGRSGRRAWWRRAAAMLMAGAMGMIEGSQQVITGFAAAG